MRSPGGPDGSPRSLFVVGAGRLGSSFIHALTEAGWPIRGAWSRSQGADALPCPFWAGDLPIGEIALADVVLLTVPDDAIAEIAAQVLAPHHVALHASGATPAVALRRDPTRPRSVATCHPLQSFPAPFAPSSHFNGAAFGIEGEPEAAAMALQLATALGGKPFVVADATAKALYHAACCMVSNGLVALTHRAVDAFEAAGLSRADALAALSPLITGTAANLSSATSPEQVLTGPIARGDWPTIDRHRAALSDRLPEAVAPYEALCREIARTADAMTRPVRKANPNGSPSGDPRTRQPEPDPRGRSPVPGHQ